MQFLLMIWFVTKTIFVSAIKTKLANMKRPLKISENKILATKKQIWNESKFLLEILKLKAI